MDRNPPVGIHTDAVAVDAPRIGPAGTSEAYTPYHEDIGTRYPPILKKPFQRCLRLLKRYSCPSNVAPLENLEDPPAGAGIIDVPHWM